MSKPAEYLSQALLNAETELQLLMAVTPAKRIHIYRHHIRAFIKGKLERSMIGSALKSDLLRALTQYEHVVTDTKK